MQSVGFFAAFVDIATETNMLLTCRRPFDWKSSHIAYKIPSSSANYGLR
jgi:hypothetical protein